MSRAFKCNRCFKCFDPLDMTSEDEFTSMPEVTSQTVEDYRLNRYGFRMETVNLCPACTKEYMMWMSQNGSVVANLV